MKKLLLILTFIIPIGIFADDGGAEFTIEDYMGFGNPVCTKEKHFKNISPLIKKYDTKYIFATNSDIYKEPLYTKLQLAVENFSNRYIGAVIFKWGLSNYLEIDAAYDSLYACFMVYYVAERIAIDKKDTELKEAVYKDLDYFYKYYEL